MNRAGLMSSDLNLLRGPANPRCCFNTITEQNLLSRSISMLCIPGKSVAI